MVLDYNIPCSGTPSGGTASAASTSFTCQGTTTLSLSGNTNASGISYQWQSSAAGAGSWSNIAGATSSSYVTATITSSTDYRCVVTCSNGGASANSSTATVTINTPVGGTSAATATTICAGSTSTLSLSGNTSSGITYQWQSSPDNSTWTSISGATSASYVASPTSTTYYQCIITCTSSASTATSSSVLVTVTGSPSTPATLPLTDNFSAACPNWVLVNGTQTNQWYQGAATGNTGNSMYVTNNSGTSNAYTNTSSSVVHFYKDIIFPAGQACITLSFDWKSVGESGYDYLRVFAVPTSTTPVAGTALSTTNQVGTDYQGQSTWQTVSITLPAAYAGTTQRLVFSWANDGSFGTNPPAAVDNISITSSALTAPGCATYTYPANGATICPTSPNLTWNAVAAVCGNAVTYDVYFNSGLSATTQVSSSQSGTSYNTGILLPGTTYSWMIVPRNATGTATGCTTYSFTTNSFVATVAPPINDGFEGACSEWTLTNGTQTNYWIQGTATNNGGSNSMYITTNGTSNAYTNTATSLVHFYRDVTFPSGLTCITLSFDWKSVGESCCDYLRVFSAPTSVTPSAGSAVSTTYQLGTDYQSQSTWQTVNLTMPASYAGTTRRIIFSWRNDGSIGTNPPAAVDNIIITSTTPPLPNCISAPSPASAATGICPVSTVISWTAPASSGCNAPTDQMLYFGTNNPPTNILNGSSIGTVTSYSLGNLSATTTYYWQVVPLNASGNASACATYSFTTSAAPTSANCTAALGTGVVNIASLPYNSGATTTQAQGNDITSTNIISCGSTSYTADPDKVYVFTPAASGNVTITMTTTSGDYGSLVLTQGCPMNNGSCGTQGGTCINYAQSSSGSQTLSACVTAGTTYYIVVDSWFSITGYLNYTLNVTAPSGGGPPSNDDPCSATALTVGTTCSYVTYTNACASASSISTPGCANYLGGDVWFTVTVPASGQLTFDTQTGVMLDGGMAIYRGSCSALTLLSCDNDNSANGLMPYIYNSALIPGETIWIRVWEYGNNNNGTFGICVTDPCPGGAPANDLPCNATTINLGSFVNGDNSCSGSASEVAAPACWTSGSNNSIWFSFIAPTSGGVIIRTNAGTLTDTQIGLYSGACGSLTLVSCNQDATGCGSNSTPNSQITATGLTAGQTYYVRVDGQNDLIGNFDLLVVDQSVGLPTSAGQDCAVPNPVCQQTFTVGNPGYQSWGYTCDLPTSYCLASGERNVVWYTLNIASNGNLMFDIVPNDYGNPNPVTGQANPSYSITGDETDYDFGVWKVSGTVTCATIAAGTSIPDRCNYDSYGVTGLNTAGNSPAAYSGFSSAYETPLAVSTGDVILIAISNYANSTSGFSLDFSGTSVGVNNYTGVPSSVTWSGGAGTTNYNTTGNWGGCTAPTCGIDAVVSPASLNQPVLSITTAGTYKVKNITIQPGASLTLAAGVTLEICGDFVNNGSLICSPSSTLLFNGTGAQSFGGSLTGVNKVGNVTVTKSSGQVNLLQDIDISGNFTSSSSTSIFNTNGNYIKVAGNFTNSSGNTTFTSTGTLGTLEFNGTTTQTYNEGSSQLDLNFVLMNHTGTGLTLSSNMHIKTITGTLTLTSGKIVTGASFEVRVLNTANACVSTGNSSSYVEGNLRRYLAAGATGSFDFPVGHSTKGYQRANLNFISAAAAGAIQLLARFDAWGGAWSQPGAPGWGPECGVSYNMPYLDNGFWSIDASSASTGTYDITLYNTNYTNSASGWSVAKSPSASPGWGLNGTCVASPVTAVQRTGMSGFSKFGIIQSNAVLPVELISFKGSRSTNHNLLEWQTASEHNSAYFEVQSSENAIDFNPIGTKNAAGNSNSLVNYTFKDYQFYSPVTYYRLKQVDIDGQYKYSKIISVDNLDNTSSFTFDGIFPNPANTQATIMISLPMEGNVKIEITDISGRILSSKSAHLREGQQSVEFMLTELSAGTYFVKVYFTNRPVQVKKLVKQ
ncbi:MAG: T9SS type A sorting domain-containing protein [Bacteroidia bacterium]